MVGGGVRGRPVRVGVVHLDAELAEVEFELQVDESSGRGLGVDDGVGDELAEHQLAGVEQRFAGGRPATKSRSSRLATVTDLCCRGSQQEYFSNVPGMAGPPPSVVGKIAIRRAAGGKGMPER